MVEAAIHAGDGFFYGSADRQSWVNQFGRFGPVFDSGIRAMMAVPLRNEQTVVAALVFASCNPDNYTRSSLDVAVTIGDAILPSLRIAMTDER